MEKLNVGIIGAGMISDVHIEKIRLDGRAEVTWLCDKNSALLSEKMNKYSIANGTGDYHALLDDKLVDVVIVATPPFTHCEAAMAVIKSNKHCIIEKPLGLNIAEVDKVAQEARRRENLKVMDCSSRHRLQPRFAYVKNIIDEGKLGDIYHIHHTGLSRRSFIEWNPKGAWAHQKKLAGGGPFMDWGVYDLAFHLGLFDYKPNLTSVKSFTKNGIKHFKMRIESDIEEHGGAYMEFDTGLTYYYERGAGVHAELPNETRIFGTKGALRFGFCSWDPEEIEFYYVDKDGNEKKDILTVEPNNHDDHAAFTNHWIDYVTGQAQPVVSLENAVKHLKIIFKIIGTE